MKVDFTCINIIYSYQDDPALHTSTQTVPELRVHSPFETWVWLKEKWNAIRNIFSKACIRNPHMKCLGHAFIRLTIKIEIPNISLHTNLHICLKIKTFDRPKLILNPIFSLQVAVSCSFFVFSVGINTSVIVLFPRARGHLYKVALFFASFCAACCHFPSLYLWCHCSTSFPSKITDIPLLLFSGAASLYAP